MTDGRKDGRTEGSVTISLRNFVGEGIIKPLYLAPSTIRSGIATLFNAYIALYFIVHSNMYQYSFVTLDTKKQ